jgi:hypothetical protein
MGKPTAGSTFKSKKLKVFPLRLKNMPTFTTGSSRHHSQKIRQNETSVYSKWKE